jgi:hypothetical protein
MEQAKCVGNNLLCISIFLALFTDGVGRHMKFHHRQQCDVVSLYGNIQSRHEHFFKINMEVGVLEDTSVD